MTTIVHHFVKDDFPFKRIASKLAAISKVSKTPTKLYTAISTGLEGLRSVCSVVKQFISTDQSNSVPGYIFRMILNHAQETITEIGKMQNKPKKF